MTIKQISVLRDSWYKASKTVCYRKKHKTFDPYWRRKIYGVKAVYRLAAKDLKQI